MSLKRKPVIIFVLICALCIIATAFYFYNKAPVNIKNAHAKETGSEALYNAFVKDSAFSQKNYAGNILLVKGIVADLSFTTRGRQIILLHAGENNGYINCTLDNNISTNTTIGSTINIKGFCSGIGQFDNLIGIPADVYMERCIIVK